MRLRSLLGLLAILVTVLVSCGPIPNEDPLDATTGMWQTMDEAQALGTPPAYLVSAAVSFRNQVNGSTPIRVCGNENDQDQQAAAAGFLALRGGTYSGVTAAQFRTAVVDGIADLIGSENECTVDDNRQLARGRNLSGFVIAADMANLRKANSGVNGLFTNWLRVLVDTSGVPGNSECGSSSSASGGAGLTGCNLYRSNNWGPRAGASRAAADIYGAYADPDSADRSWFLADLSTRTDRMNVWNVYRGFVGDTSVYSGWGDQDSTNPTNPTHYCSTSVPADQQPPVNGPSCMKTGTQPDWNGGLPEDLRRASTPPPGGCGPVDSHVFGSMEGIAVEGVLFMRYWDIIGDTTKAAQAQSAGVGGLQRTLDWSNRQDFACGQNFQRSTDIDYPGEDPKEAHIPALIQYVANQGNTQNSVNYLELSSTTLGRQASFTSYLFPGP